MPRKVTLIERFEFANREFGRDKLFKRADAALKSVPTQIIPSDTASGGKFFGFVQTTMTLAGAAVGGFVGSPAGPAGIGGGAIAGAMVANALVGGAPAFGNAIGKMIAFSILGPALPFVKAADYVRNVITGPQGQTTPAP